ncbi:hypothetical protein SAMN05216189_1010134 [Pseudomonas delhiensis]|uniref:Uncharacterized protein n=1 Tax=Pseudomonas delhiensis TaxID=366289 RepID=A0A239DYY9_9PSED|nr:hypothetical protein [Pseudomonas delhiensis]SDI93848.1 hypothetical protein SAMN05216189_1010134 [Pseudomonas delhiensis]SNS36864.1 hypothetical protein SAMN06295949_101134 [Pseudomonas delhiensis]
MSRAQPLEHGVVEQAIGWRVRLASGLAGADEQAAYGLRDSRSLPVRALYRTRYWVTLVPA